MTHVTLPLAKPVLQCVHCQGILWAFTVRHPSNVASHYGCADKKVYNAVSDVCQYRLHAIVPRYVTEYIAHHYG